ncbi:SDR family oxidoreductase [Enterococcus dispar]
MSNFATEPSELKRMGKIEDVTNLVMFLLSEESSYIWGENIYINGGML